MMTTIAFIFGCLLSVMFLGMIYGERLSLNGMFEGRWLNPLSQSFAQVWSELCQGMDLFAQFVSDHLSWVVTTVSGSIGLFIIAFLLFSGLADDAAATNRDLKSIMGAGGVLDEVPLITGIETNLSGVLGAPEDYETWLVRQAPGRREYDIFSRPEISRENWALRKRRDPVFYLRPVLPTSTIPVPMLALNFQRIPARSAVIDEDEQTIVEGRLYEKSPMESLIEDAIRMLPRSDWRLSLGDPGSLRPGDPDKDRYLEESPVTAVDRLESRVRIIPGVGIAEHDLRVEKSYPDQWSGSSITFDVRVMNVGQAPISGLVVREFLPPDTRVRDASPEAVFRDDTLMWLLDELIPFDEKILRFEVVPSVRTPRGSRQMRFDSSTEVSAATAVTSRTIVRGGNRRSEDRPRPEPEREPVPRRTPAVSRRPDLRLRILEPTRAVVTRDTIEIPFTIRNVGNADAVGVELRVTLDRGLTHHQLADDDPIREILNGVRRLAPGESREIPLRLVATRTGIYNCRAELMFEGEILVDETFRIQAETKADPLPNDRSIR